MISRPFDFDDGRAAPVFGCGGAGALVDPRAEEIALRLWEEAFVEKAAGAVS